MTTVSTYYAVDHTVDSVNMGNSNVDSVYVFDVLDYVSVASVSPTFRLRFSCVNMSIE